jgi:hypothetical protein
MTASAFAQTRKTMPGLYRPTADEIRYLLSKAPAMEQGYLRASFVPSCGTVLPGLVCEYEIMHDGNVFLCLFSKVPKMLEISLDKDEIREISLGGKPEKINVRIPRPDSVPEAYKKTKTAFDVFSRVVISSLSCADYKLFAFELGYYPEEFHEHSVETGIRISNLGCGCGDCSQPGKVLLFEVAPQFMDKPETKALEKIIDELEKQRQ